jgi:hypothetical protein
MHTIRDIQISRRTKSRQWQLKRRSSIAYPADRDIDRDRAYSHLLAAP